LLSEFKTSHPTSWQIMPALKMLARLLEESGKMDDARKSYEELADLPDAPLPLKQESAILVGKLLLRGGKYADAEKRLQKLATTLSRDDPQALFVKAYLAESQMGQNNLADVPRALGEVIKGSTDSRLRGLAHNLMGDFYRKKGQPEEAFWHYLRVDALYNEDVDEQAKALYHLTSLFDKVKKDPIRGKECATRLLDKRFSGTMYQRLMAQEMKKEK
jgi:tetratricopeptide (TPR) repeat protein